jgi:hypothetical protein
MTVEDRDQWECRLADWPAVYKLSLDGGGAGEAPFKAVPHAGRSAVLEAASPRLLRAMVREDHARRTAVHAVREA